MTQSGRRMRCAAEVPSDRRPAGREERSLRLFEAGFICLCGMTMLPAGATAVAADPVAVVQIRQQTRGLPGMDPEDETATLQQTLSVDLKERRLILDDNGDPAQPERVTRQRILRMDGDSPVIWEVDLIKNEYREHAGDLNRLQRDRRIAEVNDIQLAEKRMEPDARKRFYEDNHLRADGRHVVRVERELGEMVLGRQCEHLVVRENERIIIDAQITTDVPGAGSYYHLYRRLGVFSEEVLEQIKGIEGVPLKAKITVVTALPVQLLEVEVLAVEQTKLPADAFEPPAGAKKVEDFPADLACGYCSKELPPELERIPAKLRRKSGAWAYFCSEECCDKCLDEGCLDRPRSPPPGKAR